MTVSELILLLSKIPDQECPVYSLDEKGYQKELQVDLINFLNKEKQEVIIL